ncbi:MAG: single stranded DNA-binding domain-containing protein, partial [Candidatus Helarchaeales archaeon]
MNGEENEIQESPEEEPAQKENETIPVSEEVDSQEDDAPEIPINPEFKVVEELGPKMYNINIKVKCVEKSEIREVTSKKDESTHRVAEALIGDETGSIILTLWDDSIDKVEPDKCYNILNSYTSIFRGNLRLNLGKFGQLEESDEEILEVSLDNNLSEKKYQRPR